MQTSRGTRARGWDECSGADPSAGAATSGCGTSHPRPGQVSVPAQAPKQCLTLPKPLWEAARLLWKYPWHQLTTLPALTGVPSGQLHGVSPSRLTVPAGVAHTHRTSTCFAKLRADAGSCDAVHGSKAKTRPGMYTQATIWKGHSQIKPWNPDEIWAKDSFT